MTKLIVDVDVDKKDLTKVEKKVAKSGKDAGENYSKGFSIGLGKLALAATGIAATLKAIDFFGDAIEGAKIQEEAVNDLNIALKASGQYSKEASQDLQNYASELQSITTFGDEATLSSMALIQSLGQLEGEALKGATKAAQDMSAALGIDLKSAATLVGKAAAGEVGSFSRYGLAIKKGADNAETFANALDQINTKFGGAAQGKVNTYTGATTQLSNSIGDVAENLGFVVTKNPAFIAAIKLMNTEVTKAGDAVKDFQESLSPENMVKNVFALGDALITNVVAPFEFLMNLLEFDLIGAIDKTLTYFVKKIKEMAVSALQPIANFASSVLGAIGLEAKINFDFINALNESAGKSAEKAVNKMTDAYSKITDFSFASGLAQKNEELKTALLTGIEEVNTVADENPVKPKVDTEAAKESLLGLTDIFSKTWDNITNKTSVSVKDMNKDIAKFSMDSSNRLLGTFANSAGKAFADFGAALKNGEDGLSAFVDSFVKSIGTMLVQEGTAFIAKGIGYAFIPGMQGLSAGLISAGASMATLGGLMGASGSSSTGSSTTSTADTGSTGIESTELDDIAEPDEIQAATPGQNITLVVEGNIYDSEEGAKSILDSLNENFEKNNAIISGARLA